MAYKTLVRLSLFGALAASSVLAADPPQPEARPKPLTKSLALAPVNNELPSWLSLSGRVPLPVRGPPGSGVPWR